MSESVLGAGALKPILDMLFGIGAIVMFGEIVLCLWRAMSSRFTAGRIVELAIFGFLFATCLDWVTGFNFFKNTVAPLVWKLLGAAPS